MKEDQLTPWFPAEVKPVHVGVYEVEPMQLDSGFRWPIFSYWNGKLWGTACLSREDAEKWGLVFKTADQNRQWRGLRSKP
ncbi:hypothetical protein [Ralstonia mannitolilytica]|uniref:Uncharacterized protein n=1 Tax=Ralstonia mannitolilytica TaxID=105219 RepID=A0AAD2ERX2_9RALS|nr:hypothetical protein [Ralstonia mannitolilytica]MBY4721447.1 hypothetical protein [Ralstonia mannitolilytica]CAJ0698065.1 hypothetical protein R77591_04912 [Ralstonia mannitolilytica]